MTLGLSWVGLSVAGAGDTLLLPEIPEAHGIRKGSGCSDRTGDTWVCWRGWSAAPTPSFPAGTLAEELWG